MLGGPQHCEPGARGEDIGGSLVLWPASLSFWERFWLFVLFLFAEGEAGELRRVARRLGTLAPHKAVTPVSLC